MMGTDRIWKGVPVLAVLIFALCLPAAGQSSAEKLKDGNQARNAGHLAEAETIYRSLLNDPSVDEAAREALAQVLLWQGKYDDAVGQYQEIRQRYPGDASIADIGMARAFAWSGRHRQAIEVCEAGLVHNPDDKNLLLMLGQVESWTGQTKKSIATFDRLLATDPGNRAALLGRARALSWSGNFVRAEQEFRAILAANPDDIEARVSLIHDLIWMGHYRDAQKEFELIAQKDRARLDVRIANVALLRALGKRSQYCRELDALRAEFSNDGEVQRFARLEINELGPHIRTRGLYVRDSDKLSIMRYTLEGAFPLVPSTFLFFEGVTSDLSFPDVPDTSAGDAILGIDTAIARSLVLRVWGGSRMAEGSDNKVIGGTTIFLRTLSNVQVSAGYSESFADYTPQAARNNVRQKTADASLVLPATPRFTITGDVMFRKYESEFFSQRRDFAEASVRWALPSQGRLRTDVGFRGTYFRFDKANLDTGYYNPSDFRQILGFVTLMQRFRERTSLIADLAYGTKKVEERGWESTGAGSIAFFLPITGKIDLVGRAEYARISIITGNYSTRSASLGLLFRLK